LQVPSFIWSAASSVLISLSCNPSVMLGRARLSSARRAAICGRRGALRTGAPYLPLSLRRTPIVPLDLDSSRKSVDIESFRYGGVLVSTWEIRQRRHVEDGSLAS